MIRRRIIPLPFVVSAAAALVACGDTPSPVSLRDVPPRHVLADVEPIVPLASVRFTTQYGRVELDHAEIMAVSSGTFTEHVATVPPGATIAIVGVFSGQAAGCASDPCPRIAYLAYTEAGLPTVPGVVWTYDAHTSPGTKVSKILPFNGVNMTAPAISGTYYVGVRDIDGSVPDSGPASFGFDPAGSVDVPAAVFKVVVLGPPIVKSTVSGTLGQNGWYTSDVTVNWDVSDPNAAVLGTSGCDATSITDDGTHTLTCTANGVNGTAVQAVTIPRDAAQPLIGEFHYDRQPNANGWYNAAVTASWTCKDATSGPVSPFGSLTISGEGANQTATATCTDNAGNVASSPHAGLNVDLTPPSLAPTLPGTTFDLDAVVSANPNATDALSGIDTQSCAPVITSRAGQFSVLCTATDKAGNTATASASYSVRSPFTFGGFQSPINSSPTAWNSVKAGSSVELTFTLLGAKTLSILAAGSPTVRFVACPGGLPQPSVELPAAGPGLEYEGNSVYTYAWKTDKSWSGTCGTFVLELIDGTQHTANFQFK